MTDAPRLKIKIQIHSGDEIAMGPGKADLLDAIRVEGSISAAGRAMGMSYRRAWLLVDVMNRCWHAPLVHTAPGRAATSGARLTELGEAVLRRYRSLQEGIATASCGADYDALAACLLAEPRASQKDREAVASPLAGD
ncbi:ModE family transcriptional regulator [Novosphingobium resinovorum]|uniref:winged helix-turn-helix domain-containing protein n=1 Tax=Novosphingobium resinovorum TaxID=158500 RepID=UPI002ED3CE23|nr:ModE family transcriptional regulator [Novosphingobium resinovorum]